MRISPFCENYFLSIYDKKIPIGDGRFIEGNRLLFRRDVDGVTPLAPMLVLT
jgi:hypothetical protein